MRRRRADARRRHVGGGQPGRAHKCTPTFRPPWNATRGRRSAPYARPPPRVCIPMDEFPALRRQLVKARSLSIGGKCVDDSTGRTPRRRLPQGEALPAEPMSGQPDASAGQCARRFGRHRGAPRHRLDEVGTAGRQPGSAMVLFRSRPGTQGPATCASGPPTGRQGSCRDLICTAARMGCSAGRFTGRRQGDRHVA